MQRLGILTFHASYVEGAIYQALALQRHLATLLPAWRVELVDLRYAKKSQEFQQLQNGRAAALEEFINTQLPLSASRFLDDDHRRAYRYIAEACDALVVGSDEVWKVQYRRRSGGLRVVQEHPLHPPFPNAYWPDGSLGMPRIAYAACVGSTMWQDIPWWDRRRMRHVLRRFALLGVRDDRTREFIGWLDRGLLHRVEKVPDPAFAVDLVPTVDTAALRTRLAGWGVDFSRPRAAIVVEESPAAQAAIAAFRRAGYQTIGFDSPNRAVDVDLSASPLSPVEWMAMYGLMDVSLSQRMHGCIGNLLAGTPFVAFDARVGRRRSSSKIEDLLREFGLMRFYYAARLQPVERLLEACRAVREDPWPVEQVRAVRQRFREQSLAFGRKLVAVVAGSGAGHAHV